MEVTSICAFLASRASLSWAVPCSLHCAMPMPIDTVSDLPWKQQGVSEQGAAGLHGSSVWLHYTLMLTYINSWLHCTTPGTCNNINPSQGDTLVKPASWNHLFVPVCSRPRCWYWLRHNDNEEQLSAPAGSLQAAKRQLKPNWYRRQQ